MSTGGGGGAKKRSEDLEAMGILPPFRTVFSVIERKSPAIGGTDWLKPVSDVTNIASIVVAGVVNLEIQCT